MAIDTYPTKEEFATGHIVQSMADKADTEIIIPQTILEYGLPYEFPEEVLKEAESFKEPSAKDRDGRVDLRDLALVTIDGKMHVTLMMRFMQKNVRAVVIAWS